MKRRPIYDEAAKWYEAGLSVRGCAKAAGVSNQVMGRALHRRGVKIRPSNQFKRR